jgi:uroporphyrinogen decarboxylase
MSRSMTHRERVIAALEHREPDRVPIDLCSTTNSAIVKQGYNSLRSYLGLGSEKPDLMHRMMQVVDVGEDIKKRLDVDFRGVLLGKPNKGGELELAEDRYQDEWGVVRFKAPEGYYFELQTVPLAGEITIQDIVNFPWPDPHDPGRTRGLKEKVKSLRRETEYAIALNLNPPFVHISQYMRGFMDWYIDCACNEKLLGVLFDAILEINMAITRDALRLVGDQVDVVMVADDLGTQDRLQVSPELFRRIFKPRFKRYFDIIHELSSAKVAFHTCGSVWLLIDDLIDAGIDILNPVQVSAANMDTARLKKQFGKNLSYWGAIDTQFVLPQGNVDDVKAEVRRRIDDLAKGGGYILGAVHNIQPDVPPENIVTMFDYAREYGRYDRVLNMEETIMSPD